MKNHLSKFTIGAIGASLVAVLTFWGCQEKQSVKPGEITTAKRSADAEEASEVVSEEKFEDVMLQTLPMLDDNNYCGVQKVEGGYRVVVVKGPAPVVGGDGTALRVVCEGSGLSFVKCCKGYVDSGHPVTVSSCHDHYCGSI